jgi:hypothetical protein
MESRRLTPQAVGCSRPGPQRVRSRSEVRWCGPCCGTMIRCACAPPVAVYEEADALRAEYLAKAPADPLRDSHDVLGRRIRQVREWSTCALGITRHSPGAVGYSVMNAATGSPSWTKLAGVRPPTISQKMQFIEVVFPSRTAVLARRPTEKTGLPSGSMMRRRTEKRCGVSGRLHHSSRPASTASSEFGYE